MRHSMAWLVAWLGLAPPPSHPLLSRAHTLTSHAHTLTRSHAHTLTRSHASQRAAATSVLVGAIATVGATDTVPEGLRLMLAAVGIFAQFEYCFHRWIMHSTDDKFAEYQSLHITHHVDTERDMVR